MGVRFRGRLNMRRPLLCREIFLYSEEPHTALLEGFWPGDSLQLVILPLTMRRQWIWDVLSTLRTNALTLTLSS